MALSLLSEMLTIVLLFVGVLAMTAVLSILFTRAGFAVAALLARTAHRFGLISPGDTPTQTTANRDVLSTTVTNCI